MGSDRKGQIQMWPDGCPNFSTGLLEKEKGFAARFVANPSFRVSAEDRT